MLQIFKTDLKDVIGLIADRHDVNGKPNRLILKGRKSNTKRFWWVTCPTSMITSTSISMWVDLWLDGVVKSNTTFKIWVSFRLFPHENPLIIIKNSYFRPCGPKENFPTGKSPYNHENSKNAFSVHVWLKF